MIAPGGPDEETWSKMSKKSKRNYWIVSLISWLIILILVIYKITLS